MIITFKQFYEDLFGEGSFDLPRIASRVDILMLDNIIRCEASPYNTRIAKNNIIVLGVITIHTKFSYYGMVYDNADKFNYNDVLEIARKINDSLDSYRMMFI